MQRDLDVDGCVPASQAEETGSIPVGRSTTGTLADAVPESVAPPIRDHKAFAEEIESFVQSHSCDYVDALMTYQEKNRLEVETVASLVNKCPQLKAKLYEEAEGVNAVKRVNGRLKFAP